MNKIDELKMELSKAILESDEYKEYIELRDMVEKDPGIKRQLDEYRRENFRCQYSDDVEDAIGLSLDIDNRYNELLRQPGIYRYLSAEMTVCRMIQDVCMSVVESVDFDVEFLR